MLIEINLAPGAAAGRGKRKAFGSLKMPAMPSLVGDMRTLGGVTAGVLVVGLVGFGYWRMGAHQEALRGRVEQEVTDSIRYASTIELVRALQARQDTVKQKIDIIQDIDSKRYLWGHLLDEISKSVPAYVWLTAIGSTEAVDSIGTGGAFTIQGNAGSTQALTRFMKNLETSPYVREVTLITTQQTEVAGRTVQRFSLEARQRVPEPTEMATVPLVALGD